MYFYAPKQKGKHGKDHEKKKEKPKTLKYDVGTLAYFEQCGLTAPVTIDDVPACLEKLDAKLQGYKAMQHESSQKVDERKAEIMAKIEALNEKMAALARKAENLQDDRKDCETAEDGSPTGEDADDD